MNKKIEQLNESLVAVTAAHGHQETSSKPAVSLSVYVIDECQLIVRSNAGSGWRDIARRSRKDGIHLELAAQKRTPMQMATLAEFVEECRDVRDRFVQPINEGGASA